MRKGMEASTKYFFVWNAFMRYISHQAPTYVPEMTKSPQPSPEIGQKTKKNLQQWYPEMTVEKSRTFRS